MKDHRNVQTIVRHVLKYETLGMGKDTQVTVKARGPLVLKYREAWRSKHPLLTGHTHRDP